MKMIELYPGKDVKKIVDPYMTLSDDAETAHSGMTKDGTVR